MKKFFEICHRVEFFINIVKLEKLLFELEFGLKLKRVYGTNPYNRLIYDIKRHEFRKFKDFFENYYDIDFVDLSSIYELFLITPTLLKKLKVTKSYQLGTILKLNYSLYKLQSRDDGVSPKEILNLILETFFSKNQKLELEKMISNIEKKSISINGVEFNEKSKDIISNISKYITNNLKPIDKDSNIYSLKERYRVFLFERDNLVITS